MNIHVCRRCDGCGHTVGGYGWEMAWSRWASDTVTAERSVLRPQPCQDCGGTGALLELPVSRRALPLASRRGLPQTDQYAQHVATLLRTAVPVRSN